MRRYWWVFAALAVLAGLYHVLMSGYMTEREIALTRKHGGRQPSVADQYMDLRRLDEAINKHERRTEVLRSLTADSSTDGMTEARAAVRKRLAELEPLRGLPDDDPDVQEAFDRAARFFRDWQPSPMDCMSPKASLWSTVIFWVSFVLGALSGLVRMLAGPEG